MEKINTKFALESLEIYRQIAKDIASGEIDANDDDAGLRQMQSEKIREFDK